MPKICEACQRGSHDHCSAQVSAANAPCDCEHCWGKGGSTVFQQAATRSYKEQFPSAADAIEVCEHLKHWGMYLATAELEGILALKNLMRGPLEECIRTLENDPKRQEVLQKALSQWDDPAFLKYLSVKLPAVKAWLGV